MPCYTNLDRDEDGEMGMEEEFQSERFADYLSELDPREQKAALRTKAIADFAARYDAEHADASMEDEAFDLTDEEYQDSIAKTRYDAEERAARKAERDFGC